MALTKEEEIAIAKSDSPEELIVAIAEYRKYIMLAQVEQIKINTILKIDEIIATGV